MVKNNRILTNIAGGILGASLLSAPLAYANTKSNMLDVLAAAQPSEVVVDTPVTQPTLTPAELLGADKVKTEEDIMQANRDAVSDLDLLKKPLDITISGGTLATPPSSVTVSDNEELSYTQQYIADFKAEHTCPPELKGKTSSIRYLNDTDGDGLPDTQYVFEERSCIDDGLDMVNLKVSTPTDNVRIRHRKDFKLRNLDWDCVADSDEKRIIEHLSLKKPEETTQEALARGEGIYNFDSKPLEITYSCALPEEIAKAIPTEELLPELPTTPLDVGKSSLERTLRFPINANSTLDEVDIKYNVDGEAEFLVARIDGLESNYSTENISKLMLKKNVPMMGNSKDVPFFDVVKDVYTQDANMAQDALYLSGNAGEDALEFTAQFMDPNNENLENPKMVKAYQMAMQIAQNKLVDTLNYVSTTQGVEGAKKYLEIVEDRFLDDRGTMDWAAFVFNPISTQEYVANGFTTKKLDQDVQMAMTYGFGQLEKCLTGDMSYDMTKAISITVNGMEIIDENEFRKSNFGTNETPFSPSAYSECITKNIKPLVDDQMRIGDYGGQK
jgi:hypothetical protein